MKKNAFTLIEILVSLTIIGLIFAFGYVSFRDFSRRQALASAARQVKGDLRLAQQQAISGDVPTSGLCNPPRVFAGYEFIAFYPGDIYQIVGICKEGGITLGASWKNVTLPPDISISPTEKTILFKPLGQGTDIPAGSQVVFTLSQTGTSYTTTITVGSGGTIE